MEVAPSGLQAPQSREGRERGKERETEKGKYKRGLERVQDRSLATRKGAATGEGRVDLEKKRIKHEITT